MMASRCPQTGFNLSVVLKVGGQAGGNLWSGRFLVVPNPVEDCNVFAVMCV